MSKFCNTRKIEKATQAVSNTDDKQQAEEECHLEQGSFAPLNLMETIFNQSINNRLRKKFGQNATMITLRLHVNRLHCPRIQGESLATKQSKQRLVYVFAYEE